MRSYSIVTRTAFSLCAGLLLSGASSVFAADALTQQMSAGNGLETLSATACAERVIVEETGPCDVDSRSATHHLTSSLKKDSVFFPRDDARYSFNGNVRMHVQAARPAIGSPFGNERVVIELPKWGVVQDIFRNLLPN